MKRALPPNSAARANPASAFRSASTTLPPLAISICAVAKPSPAQPGTGGGHQKYTVFDTKRSPLINIKTESIDLVSIAPESLRRRGRFDLTLFGDFLITQQETLDLAARGLGEFEYELDFPRVGVGGQTLAHVLLQLFG